MITTFEGCNEKARQSSAGAPPGAHGSAGRDARVALYLNGYTSRMSDL